MSRWKITKGPNVCPHQLGEFPVLFDPYRGPNRNFYGTIKDWLVIFSGPVLCWRDFVKFRSESNSECETSQEIVFAFEIKRLRAKMIETMQSIFSNLDTKKFVEKLLIDKFGEEAKKRSAALVLQ